MRPEAPVMSRFIVFRVPLGVLAVAGYHVKLHGQRMRLVFQSEASARTDEGVFSAFRSSGVRRNVFRGSL